MPFKDKHLSKQDILAVDIDLTNGANQELVAGVAGKAVRVTGLILTNGGTTVADAEVNFDGGGKVAHGVLAANGGQVSAQFNGGNGILSDDGEALDITISGLTGGNIVGTVFYLLEEV